jgi:hypothetical protein
MATLKQSLLQNGHRRQPPLSRVVVEEMSDGTRLLTFLNIHSEDLVRLYHGRGISNERPTPDTYTPSVCGDQREIFHRYRIGRGASGDVFWVSFLVEKAYSGL